MYSRYNKNIWIWTWNNIRQIFKNLASTSTSALKTNVFSRGKKNCLIWCPISSLYSCQPAYSIYRCSLLSLTAPLHDCDLYSSFLFYFSRCSFSDLSFVSTFKITQVAIFTCVFFCCHLIKLSISTLFHIHITPKFVSSPHLFPDHQEGTQLKKFDT